jgi:hypothetical protein
MNIKYDMKTYSLCNTRYIFSEALHPLTRNLHYFDNKVINFLESEKRPTKTLYPIKTVIWLDDYGVWHSKESDMIGRLWSMTQ